MMDEGILRFFATVIEKELGIIYHESNFFQLQHRLEQISNQLGYENLGSFYKQAIQGLSVTENTLLLDIATNNETSFYRDAKTFQALGAHILPELNEKDDGRKIEIWSAASSSGQEVYTVAMECDMYQSKHAGAKSVDILATDISTAIIKRAEGGIYSQLEVQRGLPARTLLEYFDKGEADTWRVKDRIRRGIHFKNMNLLDSFGAIGPFDIVFCRNVLIYQSVENKKKVLDKIRDVMKPNGFLVLGAAESIFGLTDDFKQVEFDGAIFYRKVS